MTHQSNSEQRRPRIRVAVFACTAIIAIAIDQLTKWVAQARLADGEPVAVIPGMLRFTLVPNPGAALGLGSNMTLHIA
ncbi:MAG: signal peptidase II, partial [Bifidobacterium castoris]|nr:signal peptidase II [Bifidobacterium castoris]